MPVSYLARNTSPFRSRITRSNTAISKASSQRANTAAAPSCCGIAAQWRPDDGADLDSGKLDFVLDGDKLKGAWTLVRMGGKKNADGKNWLLIKRHDQAETLAQPSDLSVATGRSMNEIARARDRTWTRNGEVKPKRARTPR